MVDTGQAKAAWAFRIWLRAYAQYYRIYSTVPAETETWVKAVW